MIPVLLALEPPPSALLQSVGAGRASAAAIDVSASAPIPRLVPPPALELGSRVDLEEDRDVEPIVGPGVARFAAVIIIFFCAATIFCLRWENVDYYWYRPILSTSPPDESRIGPTCRRFARSRPPVDGSRTQG